MQSVTIYNKVFTPSAAAPAPSLPLEIFSFVNPNSSHSVNLEMTVALLPVNISLVDLIPPSTLNKAKDAKPFIEKYQGLIALVKSAISHFEAKNWKLFDPLVGENACQIRAAMLLEILASEEILSEIEQFKASLSNVEISLKGLTKYKTGSFQELIKNAHASLNISEAIFFVITSYILSLSKERYSVLGNDKIYENREKTNPKLFSHISNFGSFFGFSFVDHLQGMLSKYSVQYIQRLAMQQLHSNKKSAKLVYGKNVQQEGKRYLTPFYASTKLIINRLKDLTNTRLIFHIEHFKNGSPDRNDIMTLVYKVKKGTFQFCSSSPRVKSLEKGAMFVYAKSYSYETLAEIKERFLKVGPEQIILENAAAHPQYGVKHPDFIGRDCYNDRINSWINGTSKDFPKIVVEHVRAGGIKHYVSNRLIRGHLNISPLTTMSDLYALLSEKSGIPLERLKLRREGINLENSDRLANSLLAMSDGIKAVSINENPSDPLFINHYYRVHTT